MLSPSLFPSIRRAISVSLRLHGSFSLSLFLRPRFLHHRQLRSDCLREPKRIYRAFSPHPVLAYLAISRIPTSINRFATVHQKRGISGVEKRKELIAES